MVVRLVYKRKDGKWAWRLTADNGKVIATDGSQGYENESDCRQVADDIIFRGAYAHAQKLVDRDAGSSE